MSQAVTSVASSLGALLSLSLSLSLQ